MNPSDISNPNYFHKVVDCQWACPAHTNVPEYIRLIAQGRFADAYMLNRDSNVFPAILGRTCDRPCEPACRRGRLPSVGSGNGTMEKPVGTVVIAAAVPGKPADVRTQRFNGDRAMIKFWSAQSAMDRVRRLLA